MAAILLDIDGVLHLSGEPYPGAAEALLQIRENGHRVRLVTNNTTRARATLAESLRAMGFDVDDEDIETTPRAAAQALAGLRVFPLTMAAVHADLAELVELVEERADAVLVGGADETDETDDVFSWRNLNRAYAELERGARLVCLHKNRWWQTARGPLLDAGAFVAGLEYAAGVEAEVVGKPTPAYFHAALAALGADADETTMVGDDVVADVGGAKALGMRAVLVRTGKFREDALERASARPDAVLDSFADVPGWLAGAATAAVR